MDHARCDRLDLLLATLSLFVRPEQACLFELPQLPFFG